MSKHQQTKLSKSPQKTDFDSLSSDSKIIFFDSPVTWDTFFSKNNLYKYGNNLDNTTTRYVIILTGKNSGKKLYLKTENNEIFHLSKFVSTLDIKKEYFRYFDSNPIRTRTSIFTDDTIVSLRIEKWNTLKNYHYNEIWKNYDGTNTDGFEVILDTADIGWKDRWKDRTENKSLNDNSSSSYGSSSGSQERVEKKIAKLIEENDDAERNNIIAKLKSFVYLNNILSSLTSLDDKDDNKKILIDKILNRIAEILIENDDAKRAPIIKMISYLHHSYISKICVILQKYIEGIVEKDAMNDVLLAIFKQKEEAQIMASLIIQLTNTYAQIKEELQNKPLDTSVILEETLDTSVILEEINKILSTFKTKPYKIDKLTLYNKIALSKSHLKELVKKNRICSHILTPKQVGPICWFMSSFVAMFYSQRSRDVIIKSSETWDNKIKDNKINKRLFRLLRFVLNKRYVKTDKEDNYPKFSDNIFVDILRLLFKIDGFPYDPDNVNHTGFIPDVYICKLYKLLGIDYKIFDIMGFTVAYSYYNKEYDLVSYEIDNGVVIEKIKNDGLQVGSYTNDTLTPPILIIRYKHPKIHSLYTRSGILKSNTNIDRIMKNELTSMDDKICYNGKVYILDSVILKNWNDNDGLVNHGIVGITCEGYKYVYNGWVRTIIDKVGGMEFLIDAKSPCELMPYDWNIIKDNNFCLNNYTCIPDIWKKVLKPVVINKIRKTELCFNFSQGIRTLIYVRQDTTCDDKDRVM
jgi:hypothetical protein